MRMSNTELIKYWEELRLEAYLPTPNDVWTIGWGHTKGVKKGDTITVEEAKDFLREDIAWAEAAVNDLVKVKLNQNQFDALVSFVFNVGTTNFKKSTLLKKLNAGDYNGAAEQFPRWNKQKGKVLNGLVKRRADEMQYFLSASETPVQSVDSVDKPLAKSKEVVGGLTALLTGLGALLGGLDSGAQQILSVGLSVALIGFGAFFIWNRVKARKKGDR